MPTAASLGPISPFHFGDEQVIKGIPQEFVDRMVLVGGSTGHLRCTNPHGSGNYLCFYDREYYKWIALGMLREAGADILFHASVIGPLQEGAAVRGVSYLTKSGVEEVACSVVVDATGDGDIAARAGAEVVLGRESDGMLQPGTLMFDMGKVDVGALKRYMDSQRDEFEWTSECVALRPFSKELVQQHFVGQGFSGLVRHARSTGELYLGRDSILFLTTLHAGVVHFNSTRITGLDGTSGRSFSEGEEEGRHQVMSLVEFLKRYIPGMENAYLAATGTQIGVRETRHIVGEYVLSGDDVVRGAKFPDVVARGYFPIDIHSPSGAGGYGAGSVWTVPEDSYDIPLRCLIPKELDGLVVAGRSISATHEAHGSLRTQGGVMAIGQAAGTVAGLASLAGVEPRVIAAEEVQRVLVSQGASLWRDGAVAAAEARAAESATRAAVASGAITGLHFGRPGSRAPRL
jgi:hypothetical protein